MLVITQKGWLSICSGYSSHTLPTCCLSFASQRHGPGQIDQIAYGSLAYVGGDKNLPFTSVTLQLKSHVLWMNDKQLLTGISFLESNGLSHPLKFKSLA